MNYKESKHTKELIIKDLNTHTNGVSYIRGGSHCDKRCLLEVALSSLSLHGRKVH